MATDRALITKLQVLAAAIETTTGTAVSLSGSNAVFNVMDAAAPEAEIPAQERQAQGTLSPMQPRTGAQSGRITFKHEVMGAGSSGSDPGWLATFIAACGFAKAGGSYSPISGNKTTLTMGAYIDGRFFEIAGAMGDVTFDAEVGKPMMGSYTFTGLWVPPTSVALPTPAYPTTIPPIFAGAVITIGGTAYRISKVQIAMGNQVTLRQDGNAGTGYHAAGVFNRAIRIRVNPEALALGTQDWFAAHLAGTNFAFSCQIGSASHNTITFACPKMVLLNPPKSESDNSIYRDALEFVPFSTTSGGDDDLSISAS